ncbi:MAG: 4a-hydroxytetrahydrobiopterin dehydratase [Cetobacterium sp.]
MKNISLLSDKHCIPCQGGIPPLGQEEINKLLDQLKNGWEINKSGHLYKRFEFNDFMGGMEFANKIALIAEQEAHHPDLTVSWGRCAIEIWTHKINGLNESDFILAAKIETIKK